MKIGNISTSTVTAVAPAPAKPARAPSQPWGKSAGPNPIPQSSAPPRPVHPTVAAVPAPVAPVLPKEAPPVMVPAPLVEIGTPAIHVEPMDVLELDPQKLGLKLVRTIIRCPDWKMKVKGAKIMTNAVEEGSTEENPEAKAVKGKTTSPSFVYSVHPLFDKLAENERKIRSTISIYTIVDAEDGLRLISVHKEAEYLSKIAALRAERLTIAKSMDIMWFTDIVPAIQLHFGKDFPQMVGRLEEPPFGPKVDINVILRKSDLTNPDEINWENMDADSRKAAYDMTTGFIKKFALERATKIVEGVMQPILDLALKINGKEPNPKYDPALPEGPKNRKFMPPYLETGRTKDGTVEQLIDPIQRMLNFSQVLPPEILAQVKAAQAAVARTHGKGSNLNDDAEIQKAIKFEITKLSGMLTDHIKEGPSRRERALD